MKTRNTMSSGGGGGAIQGATARKMDEEFAVEMEMAPQQPERESAAERDGRRSGQAERLALLRQDQRHHRRRRNEAHPPGKTRKGAPVVDWSRPVIWHCG